MLHVLGLFLVSFAHAAFYNVKVILKFLAALALVTIGRLKTKKPTHEELEGPGWLFQLC